MRSYEIPAACLWVYLFVRLSISSFVQSFSLESPVDFFLIFCMKLGCQQTNKNDGADFFLAKIFFLGFRAKREKMGPQRGFSSFVEN